MRREDGSMVVFAMFLLIGMLIVAGMAVDFMRIETNRQVMQSVADRAVLAAAALDQEQSPEDVVRDYFNKAGLTDVVDSVTVGDSINQRSVRVDASTDLSMIFTQLIGLQDLHVPVLSAAAEAETDLEIMLVLDVSGSMASDNKLQYLQDAANEFVDTIFAADTLNRITIGIVPFNGQVNLGPQMPSLFSIFDDPNLPNVNCLDVPAAAYATSGIPLSLPMPNAGYFDSWYSTTMNGYYYSPQAPVLNGAGIPTAVMCTPFANNRVVPPTRDADDLHDRINDLYAIGATSINLGMRWGTALMDPSARSLISTLGSLLGLGGDPRPFDYGRNNTRKIIVLMTDGENFEGDRLNDGFRTGLSPIWRSGNGRYSIYHPSKGRYWRPDNGSWSNSPYSYYGATQLTWPEVWSDLRMKWVAYQLYGRALATGGRGGVSATEVYNDTMDMFRTTSSASDLNAQLQQQCTLARGNGEIIYTIAFQAPSNGQSQLAQCASSPSHYYDANGLEISTAFRNIANQITALRLTQ